MNSYIIYGIALLQLFSFSLLAQDDSEEDSTGASYFNAQALIDEEQHLDFKASFIESIQQKSIENYKKALESLAKCENIYPENVAMLFEKAKNHFSLKQYIEAHQYCDKALSIEPNNVWLLTLSRRVYEKEFNYPEAIAIQKKLFGIKNSEAENLLKLYYRTKNKKEGQAFVDEINEKYIYVQNIDFYEKYFKTNAITTAKKPIEKNNLNNNNLSDLKNVFLQKKEYKILQEILEKEAQSKQFEALLSDSDMGLTLFPAQAKIYLYKGNALNGLGKYKEAIAALEAGLDFVFENTKLIKQFYNALIVGYSGTNNTSKVNHYKQLVQKL